MTSLFVLLLLFASLVLAIIAREVVLFYRWIATLPRIRRLLAWISGKHLDPTSCSRIEFCYEFAVRRPFSAASERVLVRPSLARVNGQLHLDKQERAWMGLGWSTVRSNAARTILLNGLESSAKHRGGS